ncbi:hypothetical protein FSP39_023226 [Pinctada imbricata]|uniref:Cytokine receptor-like factor 3 n=1 Tax=Pinctada imbricata TaxID=66713 RepID=A0AA88Y3U7_PINIB|nr:hypothetical protein FSP39_023226 [Pinctada imbricata]
MSESLVQNVVDTMASASMQKSHLVDLLSTLKQAKEQITVSASSSREGLKQHFQTLRKDIDNAIQRRLDYLLGEVGKMEEDSLTSITGFEDTVKESLQAANQVIEEGKQILSNNPEENVEALVKFKENPQTKNLECILESPSLSDVPYISADVREGLSERVAELITKEGRVVERAPVQISDIIERPGGLLVKWMEVEEELEDVEFCLQYCNGNITYSNINKATFHDAYTGPLMCHTVRHLRTKAHYSFRVRCRVVGDTEWSVWCVPRSASTSIPHYQWNTSTDGYSTSNENKTANREAGEVFSVLYSNDKSYVAGCPITFKILDVGETSPLDGIGLSLTNEDLDTMRRKNAIFVSSRGCVYVDGQEMKTKLPSLGRNSKLNIDTEDLSNGKIRVSVEVEGKEVTSDWKLDQSQGIKEISDDTAKARAPSLYFGMQFSHENWKVMVE